MPVPSSNSAELEALGARGIDVEVRLIHPDIAVLTPVHRNATSQFVKADWLNPAKP
jgi:hypothetical protein